MQLLLGRFLQQPGVDVLMTAAGSQLGFFQDIADALVGGGQGRCLRQAGKHLQCCQPARDVSPVLQRTGGQCRFDVLYRIALVAEISTQPVEQKLAQFITDFFCRQ